MKTAKKPRIALIFGGRGYEHSVSVAGADFVLPLIDEEKYTPLPVYISRDGEWLVPRDKELCSPSALAEGRFPLISANPAISNGVGGLLTRSEFIPVDAAFPLLHGDFGEDGVIQGALESSKIPFVGCDCATGAILSDKSVTKAVARHLNIPTAPFVIGTAGSTVEETRCKAEDLLGYPMFIKPTRLGSSIGARKVTRREDFVQAYECAARLGGDRVLIEEQISITAELECAYFSDKSKELFTNIGQIICEGGFYDFKKKYSGEENVSVMPRSVFEAALGDKIREYSRLLVSFFGIRDISRIDFFLDGNGRLLFNEINSMPGFTDKSLYPMLVANAGIPPALLVSSLIDNALYRGA